MKSAYSCWGSSHTEGAGGGLYGLRRPGVRLPGVRVASHAPSVVGTGRTVLCLLLPALGAAAWVTAACFPFGRHRV